MTNFEKVNPKQSFPQLEEAILQFWKENNIFEKSIENRKDAEEFNFYDGPPFATGTPHYGHILAGTIKDVIPRYQTMKGKKVERKFGWDTHGLPIENIVEKKLEIKGKEDLEERIGVHTFNETCRENVFGYVDEWEKIVNRMGRWVDMENDYKTMDTDFMESVWWFFSEMHKKGLIYEGHRVVPYSVGMSTPLSNFEVNQGYKDKQDKTATVKFKVQGSENKYILAWTTTPWTLVANLGLAVGTDIDYVELLDTETKETYILAKDRIGDYYKLPKDGSLESEAFTLVKEYKGSCLVGIKYEALFPDFVEQLEAGIDLGNDIFLGKNAFSVIEGHHVTTESGTGVVHIAPAYGEDDYQIGQEQDLGFVIHIGDSGKTYNLLENNGVWVFDYNEQVIEILKKAGSVVKISTINHSYPHCWRSGVPLIYKAISAWYVDVTQIKDEMVKNNRDIKWVPGDIKNGRMGKWLEGARDWNISRNRYWGSAIPVWQSEDKEEQVVIGSIEELYQANKDYGQITKVIFVRHGRTDYNEKGLMDYQNKAQLTEIGKKQAEEIATIFANEEVSAIYSSPLDRCIDTISPLAASKNLEIIKKDAFREVESPDLQDKEFSCKNYKWDNGYGGGEKISEVYDRVNGELQELIEKHKGETIIVCAHGDITYLGRQSIHNDIDYDTQKYTSGKYLENNPEKYDISSMYGSEYIYTNTKKAVDLHKHFVDEIFVKNEKNFVANNVLGIHGMQSDIQKDSWQKRINLFNQQGLNLYLPQFDISEDPDYKNWENTFANIDFSKYDTIYTSSYGGIATVKYLFENNIKLKRLVSVVPGRSNNSINGKYVNTNEVHKSLENKDLSKIADECIVIHAQDDEVVPFEEGKKFAKKLGAHFIELKNGGHNLKEYYPLIAGIVKHGVPLQRIPEVLDCWFESGSMPYASKHYPFEEKIIFKNDFFISRHGISEHNVKKITNSQLENKELYGLTQEGIQGVEEEAKKCNKKFDIIVTSPFRRAKETAKIYQKYCGGEIMEEERLKERDMIKFEGQSTDTWKKGLTPQEKLNGNKGFEGTKEGVNRGFNLLTELNGKYTNKKILFVSHGMITSALPLFLKDKDLNYEVIKQGKIIKLENNFKFPADFIAEGLDQTRGWFYTLIIIGTALFGVAPMKNVIVNGIILAEDGKKMSKSLKNYPDPNHIFDAYGADAMRFYLLNSPVVEAQDFRFAEIGVEEVVKKVMLPLWNTYYFFTTYANIDNFEPQKGNTYFVRHGETDNNKFGRVNGGESAIDINEAGIEQAHKTGKELQAMGVTFDKIITSPMLRAKHTAEIINSYIGNVEVEEELDLQERNYGKFGGKTFEEIAKENKLDNNRDTIRKFVLDNAQEPLNDFIKRSDNSIKEILKRESGKNILIIGHAGNYKALLNKNNPNVNIDEYINSRTPKNAGIFNLNQQKLNILDKWLISELNELIKEVREAFDNYELNKATKPIFRFMDNLTNWYIRRSRKRFWKSENDGDKIEAYETLYYTLVELTKIIAPFMPFISDHIYRELVRDENTSVHLTDFPTYDESAIDLKLNADTDTIQKIITLGLAFRANRKIRVRQPLQSITVTETFSDFYENILKEELNVKEVLVVDGEDLAKKICKPNGRAIGPKFGKDVKFIMSEAKAGNFEELENGNIKVGDFELETGDFELEYIKADENAEIEAGFGMVISMNSEITPELEQEGFARDIVRHIQEARKEANYNVEDRISLELKTENSELQKTVLKFKEYIETETLSSFGTALNFEKEVEIEGMKVKICLEK